MRKAKWRVKPFPKERGLLSTALKSADLDEEYIRPHPKQREFLKVLDRYTHILLGGARGGGKSRLLRWGAVRWLLLRTAEGFKNLRFGIFNETYKETRLRQFDPAKVEFPRWLGRFVSSPEHSFLFRDEYGGHRIDFLNLKDLKQYEGAEFAGISIDEITHIPDYETFARLGASRRTPGIVNPPYWAAATPTGPGKGWVKKLWIDRDFSGEHMKLPKEQFIFIQLLPSDNPSLPSSYVEENLESLPDFLRKAWAEGDWNVPFGARFAQFRRHVHVCEPFDLNSKGIPYKVFASIDYGVTESPWAVLFFAVYPENVPPPRIFLFREYREFGIGSPIQIERFKLLAKDMKLTAVYLDSACWGETDEGLSIADKYIQAGIQVVPAKKDRVAGWDALDHLFDWRHEAGDPFTVTQEPLLKIFETCPLTIGEIESLVSDPKKPLDILHPSGFRDDLADALRYFALSHSLKAGAYEPPPKLNTKDYYDKLAEDAFREYRRRNQLRD